MDSQNVTQDLTTNKLKKKLRYSGIIAACFILVQCIIWIILSIIGICYFFTKDRVDAITFDAFKYVPLKSKGEKLTPTLISPIVFNLICWFYLFGCSVWLALSAKSIQVLYDWNSYYTIKKYLKIWIFFTLFVCAIDLLFSALFLVDFNFFLQRNDDTDENLYEFKAADSFDMTLDENLKEIKVIGNIENDIREELKEYLLLKAHVKNQFVYGSLILAANNNTFQNPFQKTIKKIKRELLYTRGKYNHIVFAMNEKNFIPSNNKKKLEIPSAILMTIFIRGIIVWIVNLIMVAYISYLYFF